MARHVRGNLGRECGDPAKAVAALLTVVGFDKPPLRLLLGSDALRIAELIGRQRQESDVRWRELTVSTDVTDNIAATANVWKG